MPKGTSLQDMILGYRFEETYELGEHKILMQSLTSKEKQEILQTIAGLDYVAQLDAVRVPTLARAIVRIDGKAWESFPEIRDMKTEDKSLTKCIEEFFSQQSDASVRILYNFYLDLEKKHDEELRKVSKEELVNPTPGPSGGSVKPSGTVLTKSET